MTPILTWIHDLGPWGPILFILFYAAATAVFIPGSVLTIAAGALFGVVEALILVSIGATLGAAAGFLIARYAARDAVARRIKNTKFSLIDAAVAEQGWKIVLLTRLSPLLPFSVLNYGFGLTQISFRHFTIATWIGTMPGIALYVYLGSLAQAVAGPHTKTRVGWALYFLGLLATVLLSIYITKLARNSLAQKTPRPGQCRK